MTYFIDYMMTSSNGNIFRVTGPLCGEFTSPGEFPTQRPVTRSFDVFFDLRLNKRLSKQPWGWWFETPSWSLRRQCNELIATEWRIYASINYIDSYNELSVRGKPIIWSCWRHQIGTFLRVTGPLCREFIGQRWIPLTKTTDAELWCFLWSAPE